jgi:hypothetical protein
MESWWPPSICGPRWRRAGFASAPLLGIATLISIPAYFTMLALFSAAGEKQMLNLVGPLTLAFLMVTAIAQRANVRR